MTGFTNFEEMFAQSIGLTDPWKIERAEFDEEKQEVHIYVTARKTAKYPCPKCGKMCDRYDDEESERVWRHGDVVFFPCYVHCRRPRIKCENKTHVVTPPWSRAGSRFTLLFESYAMLLVQAMTVNQARKTLRISPNSSIKRWLSCLKNIPEPEEPSGWFRGLMICINVKSRKTQKRYLSV